MRILIILIVLLFIAATCFGGFSLYQGNMGRLSSMLTYPGTPASVTGTWTYETVYYTYESQDYDYPTP